MAGERQLVALREHANVIETRLTDDFGYDSSNLDPKGAENYLSYHIHLGEMDWNSNGLTWEQRRELTELKQWRQDIANTGVEDYLRF